MSGTGTTIPNYKLYYFGIRGRGEPVRYMFAAANIPYDEELVPFQSWPEVKKRPVPA